MDAVEEGWQQTLCCNECNKWCHKRCSGLRNVLNFLYPRCAREGEGGDDYGEDEGPGLAVNGGSGTILLLGRCAGL